MPNPKAIIMRRRAELMAAALSAVGCSSASHPVKDTVTEPVDAEHEPAQRTETPPSSPIDLAGPAADVLQQFEEQAAASPQRRVVIRTCLSIIQPPKISFATNSANINDKHRKLIDLVVQVLEDHQNVRVEVQGHTDPREVARGRPMGLHRALAVRNELVRLGVAPDRICVRDFRDSRPLADPATVEGRAKNRRIEFRNMDQGEACGERDP